jgi:DNA invertase Pin-like site-specific DNA recombinase
MASYGYARVSSTDQDLTLQTDALMAAGCTILRSEKVSGTSRDGRTELQIVLDFIRSSVPTTSVVRGCHHGPSLSEAH